MNNILREREICRLLNEKNEVTVEELSRHLGVSEATVRRDLKELEHRRLLKRTHGGATRIGLSRLEPLFQDKQALNREAKEKISQRALHYIQEDDHIYLDGGSTVLALARKLDQFRHLTIVTNSLMAAVELMDTSHELILVGGSFRSLSRTLVGPLTLPIINQIHVDKAFMGTIGFTPQEGMMTTDFNEAFTKECIMKKANKVILLADSSKLGVKALVKSGQPDDIDVLITERYPGDAFYQSLQQVGIYLEIAE